MSSLVALRVELVQPVGGGHAELDGALVVLREVADGDLVAPLHGAGVDGDVLLFDAGAVGEQRLEQRGLALAVAADEDDLVAALDGGGEVVDDVLGLAVGLGVGLVDVLELEDVLAGGALHLEGDVRARDVGAGELAGGEALDFLLARVHLRDCACRRRSGR